MEIDLITFSAQVINLIILLFLLRKFLYLPVLKVVAERQKFIADTLKNARDEQAKAQQVMALSEEKLAEIESQKNEILRQAGNEAKKLGEKLQQQAYSDFADEQNKWRNKIVAEQNAFTAEIQHLTVEHFVKFADQALKQMADVELNEHIIKKFSEQIKQMPEAQKLQLCEVLQKQRKIEVQSAYELSEHNKDELRNCLQQQLKISTDTKLTFVANQKLVCGVAIAAHDQLISWNLAEYADDFYRRLNSDVQKLLNKG